MSILENLQAQSQTLSGAPLSEVLPKCTHVCIASHPDDIELLGLHGILNCIDEKDRGFLGVVVTDGAGSARSGAYAKVSNDEMVNIRSIEQKAAALVGRYEALVELQVSSQAVRDNPQAITEQLEILLNASAAKVIYTHNPFDRHGTHLSVLSATLKALAQTTQRGHFEYIYGVEVWRALDWLPDAYKVCLDVGRRMHLTQALIGLFDSQIAGGKRYDLAMLGRLHANATFGQSHATDDSDAMQLAIDLKPLLDSGESLAVWAKQVLNAFEGEIAKQLVEYLED